jgi:hypothetical protein
VIVGLARGSFKFVEFKPNESVSHASERLLTSLREKLMEIGAQVVSHGRYLTFPDSRGRGAAADVCGNLVAHRPAAGAAHSGMTAAVPDGTDDEGRGASG